MSNGYYKIPMDFGALLDEERGDAKKVSELESIDQHIGLLIMTCPGEHIFDRRYGTAIWEMDFERIMSLDKWQTQFMEYLAESVGTYERRLSNCSFRVEITDVLHKALSDNVNIRKRVDIYTTAILVSNGDPCRFRHRLYLGPLSKE